MALKGAEACTDDARQLLIDLQRNPDFIPPYNEERMRKCTETINTLFRRNAETFQLIQSDSCPNPDETAAILQVQNEILKRIKQCVLVYHRDRLQRLRKLRWTIGCILPPEIKANLSEAENDWYSEYNRNLAEYQNHMGVDLMRGMEPPKSLLIQVRVLEDYGEFETSDGKAMILTKGSIHYLPMTEIETLLQQKILEEV
ncbi:hypothetical protein QR680_005074 [Steinernema hermaphroditum]|uniref:DNA replication complex GINS protein PSF1 n=1 Tax=Steinernema hermaphroditum TaxID=289476 RepID=A0AA39HSY1_9BILA|nr:hypothetical protein QR680_005074 [Steinernema hermaphroditum]